MASSPKIDELRKKFEETPRRYFAPLANEYRKAGDLEQAIAICREYLPQQPGHMSGHIVFGQALFDAKQLDESKTVFETALSLDPENLIALKHLGDITAATGDKEAAKGWYKRVLDADPRNEETQALLAKLEGPKPAEATPAAASQATPVSATMPMPAVKPAAAASAPTVVMQAMRPLPKLGATGLPMPAVKNPAAAKETPVQSLSSQPTVPIQVPGAAVPPAAPAPAAAAPAPPATPPAPAIAPTQEIRLDGFSSGADSASKVAAGSSAVAATVIMEAAPGMKPVSAAEVPVVPALGLETTAVAGAAAPIDSFSLEGLETTSMAAPPAPAPAAAADAGMIDLDFAPPAAPTAPAPPAAAPLPSIDLDFAAPSAPAPAAPPPPPVQAAPADAAGLVDLEISIPAPVVPTPVPVAPPPPAPAAAAPIEIETPAPTPVAAAPAPIEIEAPATPESVAPAPAPVELDIEVPAPAPDSGPFVTETMAELYLKQGHRDEALRVYRALLEQRPDDAGIQAKIAELTGAAAPAPEAPVAAPVLPPSDGPSIRSVLMLIAMRRPGYRPDPSHTNGASHAEPSAPVADAEVPHGADSLSHLWDHAAPPQLEEAAALVLSAAFRDLDGHTHGNGAMDLSAAAAAANAAQAATAAALASGAPAPASSFSFDKFFSQRATAEHAAQASPAAGGAPAESKEDVAQFTQWLEGLKKR
jgi:hypothetical protein